MEKTNTININKEKYRISAYDMLFFGTGRPFTMEDESWTKGIFPPYPSTFYGYIRTTYFENNMSELSKANEDDDPTKVFKINDINILLFENGEFRTPLYPIPYGHVIKKEGNKETIEALKLKESKLISSNPFGYVLTAHSDGKLETADNTIYVSKDELENYLNGKPITNFYKITEFLTTEERIGIAKNLKTGKTEEGKLYRISFNHLYTNKEMKEESEIHFGLEIEADLPKKHFLSMGGEGKHTFLNEFDFKEIVQPEEIQEEAVIYFSTPAIFDCKEIEKYGEIQFIANDKPVYIGGWDIKARKPKPMKRAYPAGTQIFIKFNNGGKDNFIKSFKNNKIGEMTEQGFGRFYIGNQHKSEK